MACFQACDSTFNKNLKRNVRLVRDQICKFSFLDTKSIQFKLMCFARAWERITVADVTEYFQKTVLCLVDYISLDFYPSRSERRNDTTANVCDNTSFSDMDVVEKLKSILNREGSAAVKLRDAP